MKIKQRNYACSKINTVTSANDGREFVITDPRTPRPWFNYMWNESYAGLISHTWRRI